MTPALLLLRFDAGRARAWMRNLVAALKAEGFAVRIDAVRDGAPLAGSVAALFALERLVLRRGQADASERITPESLGLPLGAGEVPAITIDFAAQPAAHSDGVLRVLHGGVAGEDALLALLFGRVLPVSEVVDAASGVTLERIKPSMEAAAGISGQLANVGQRLTTVLLARIRAMVAGAARPAPIEIAPMPPGRPRPLAVAAMRMVAGEAAARAYRLCCYAPHWRTGWRLHDGPGLIDTGDFSGPAFRVLPEPAGHFYADPFPITWRGKTAVFLEDLDHRTGKGVIVAVPFGDAGPSGPALPVLEEPWHLSYPFLVEEGGELYMIPECSTVGLVALYRCLEFPARWERCATLLEGPVLADVTLVARDGRWWMFAASHDGVGGWSDTLALFSAPSLFGPWQAHAHNPIFVDCTQARPAGAIVERGGRLIRPVQDCSASYGGALGLAEITRLDEGGYAQVLRTVLRPGPHWPGRKLHTLNRHGRLEVIDGSVIRPRSSVLAGMVEARSQPRVAAP